VQGVLAAEDREGTGAGGQPTDAVGAAVQDLLDARVVLVMLVAQLRVVVEVAARACARSETKRIKLSRWPALMRST